MATTSFELGKVVKDPALLKLLRRLENDFLKSAPVTQYEYKTVTFNSTANANTDIVHSLRPENPEDVDYQVVSWEFTSAPGTAPIVYKDTSASRRPWGDGYIVLKCNVASATATLLLSIRRT
jgi:hypothetical protein